MCSKPPSFLSKEFLAAKRFFAVARFTDFSAAFTNFSYTQSANIRSVQAQAIKYTASSNFPHHTNYTK